jgi:ABC-type dipeptide/oligopeptide/nickel transport system permease component
VFAISAIVFLMLYLTPGDPAIIYLGDTPATPERVMQMRHAMGLDRPLLVQYIDYLERLGRGDLGRSLRSDDSVLGEIRYRTPSSAELAVAAFGVTLVVGIGLGITSALRRSTWLDAGAMLVAMLGVSMPVFWLGLMLIFVFSLQLGWFPATGFGGWQRLVLPAVTLGLLTSATLARLARSSVLEILWQPYVRTAHAKGLRARDVVRRHVMRNVVILLITVAGLQLGELLSGAVITESVFARPGLGKLLVDSILNKDFPVVQGVVLLIAVVYTLLNLAVDLSYAYFDPRIRFE